MEQIVYDFSAKMKESLIEDFFHK